MSIKIWSVTLVTLVCSMGFASAARPTHYGTATYYSQGGAAGSCGTVHSDSDYIVAISDSAYTVSNHCGKTVTITNTGGGDYNTGEGKTLQATVADTCPSCGSGDLDLSTGLWKAFHGSKGMEHDGVFSIQWHFD